MANIGELIKRSQENAGAQREYFEKSYSSRGDAVRVSDSHQAESVKEPNVVGRVSNTVSGGLKDSAAGVVGFLGLMMDAAKNASKTASSANRKAHQEAENAAHYREMLERGTMDDGTAIDQAQRERLEMLAERAERRSGIYAESVEKIHAPAQEVTDKLYAKADDLAEASAKDITEAKAGLGKAGQFAVDAGAALTQMVGDAPIGLAATFVRGVGSSAQEARQSGAGFGQQLAYGLGSGALSVATEKIANVAEPFKKAFGSGVLDDAIMKAAGKLGGSAAGKVALSAISEGGEEFAEAVFQPVLQRATYNQDAKFDLSEALYEAAIGATLGGLGGAVDSVAGAAVQRNGQNAAPDAAASRIEESEGKITPAQKTNAETPTEAKETAPDVGAKKSSDRDTYTVVAKLKESIPALSQMEPVARASVQTVDQISGSTMAEKAKKMFEAIKGVVTRPGFGDVEINGRSVKDDLSHGVGAAKASTISAVPEVIRKGQQIYFKENWKGRGYDGYVFAAPVVMDGGPAYVAAVVKRTSKNRFYLHEVVDSNGNIIKIDAGDGATPTSLAANGDAGARSQASVEGTRPLGNTVSQAGGGVNVENLDPLMQAIFGGQRVDAAKVTDQQRSRVDALYEQGEVGMDARQRLFRVDPAQHMDQRTMENVRSKGVNAFRFDHPQLHQYYVRAANALIADADLSLTFPMTRSYERGMQGNQVNQKVQASEHLRLAMDETGLSRKEPIDAAQRIINDQGQENVSAAKRVEVVLDEMLTRGWETMNGVAVGPNQAYIQAKSKIAGSRAEVARESTIPDDLDGLKNESADGTMDTARLREGAYAKEGQQGRNSGENLPVQRVERTGEGENPRRKRTPETADGFSARIAGEGGATAVLGGRTYGFRRVNREAWTSYAEACVDRLRSLGIAAEVMEGNLQVNTGTTTIETAGDAVTAVDGTVFVKNDARGFTPQEIVGHEGFHSMLKQRRPKAVAYQDAIQEQLAWGGEDVTEFVENITDNYFPNGFDPMDAVQAAKFFGELSAYVSGMMNDGLDMSFLFRDYGSVQSAWEAMMESTDDGLGAANAGSLNSAYDNLQAQSSSFHPEGAYAARPVDVPTTNFEGRNIPKAASTIMGAQGIDESDVRFLEQQIADGKLAFDTITDKAVVKQARQTMQDKGFDGALEQYRQAVAGNVATKDNTALGQQLLLQAMREGNTAYTAELLALYTRNSTTAAQAMQAQSIFRKLSPEGQLVAVQKAVDALNEKYGTDVELEETDVADFLEAGTDEERQEVTKCIIERAAQNVPGTFKAKYDTLRYLAMLGNPRTHIRNILGNTFFQVPVAVKNRVGAVAEGAAYRVSGGKTERTKSLFGANPMGALAKEARADWVNARDFLGQTSKYMEGQATLYDIESEAKAFGDGNLLGRGINALADKNSKLLEAEDTAAKKWIYAQSLAGYLKANGCRSLADADPALLYKARTYAANEALRNTFNDKNAVSDAVAKLGGASRSSNPAIKAAGYMVEGILPFKRTPANIAVRAVEYSPVGTVLGIIDTARGARGGDMDLVARGLDRTAAGMTGTALLAAGFLAAGAGYVTGGEDEDQEQQDFDELTGHQNYALETKGGTSVTLDWLAPEAIPFFMGVELYEQGIDSGISFDEVWEAVKGASAPMLEMSMLQGLNDLFENVSYAQQRGDNPLAALVTSALASYVTQVFPTAGGQLERSGEDVRMTTYTDKNSRMPTDLQYIFGKVSQKVPGWDFQQIPYIDAWGREEETGDFFMRLVSNTLNPAYVSQVDVDKVESELQRLKDATGENSVFPERAPRSFTEKTVDGKGVTKNLTSDEYVKYAKKLGETSFKTVQSLTTSAAYQKLSDTDKVKAVSYAYQYANAVAKMSVSTYQPEKTSFAGGAMNSILPIDSYILYKVNADRDGNGSVDGTESAQTLWELTGITDRQRGDAWAKANSTASEMKNPFVGALPQAGMDTDTAISIYDKYRTLYSEEGMKVKDKAKQFKAYIYSLGLPARQLAAVKKTYRFWGSYPVEW